MNDAENIGIGVAILLGGAYLLYFLLRCVFNGQKDASDCPDERTCLGMCKSGSGKKGFLCLPCINFPKGLTLGFQFTHFYQLFFSLATFFIIVWGVYYIFGSDAVHSLLTGFMIGGGLALKPLMKTVVSGFTADGVNLCGRTIVLTINSEKVDAHVVRIGMLHTWVSLPNGELVMIHNDLLNSQPIVIKNSTRY